VLTSLIRSGRQPGVHLAMGLPDMPRYRTLIAETGWALERLQITLPTWSHRTGPSRSANERTDHGPRSKQSGGSVPVDSIRHEDKRLNIPTARL